MGGPSSVGLAHKICEILNLDLIKIDSKRFPDGEFYFKFVEDIEGEDLLIIQSLYPPQDRHLIELFFLLHTARNLNAKAIQLFIPYLAYSRQDRIYMKGECLSSALIAETIESLGVDRLYTVDIHNKEVLKRYRIPTHNLMASGELAEYFAKNGIYKPFIISPDDEETAICRAEIAAKVTNTEYDFFKKHRDRKTGEIVTQKKSIPVKGRDVIIIDDIISTGKTSANAAKILKRQGARRVLVGASHALLNEGSLDLLKRSGVDSIIGTDCVVNEFSKVSVAPILAKALKKKI